MLFFLIAIPVTVILATLLGFVLAAMQLQREQTQIGRGNAMPPFSFFTPTGRALTATAQLPRLASLGIAIIGLVRRGIAA